MSEEQTQEAATEEAAPAAPEAAAPEEKAEAQAPEVEAKKGPGQRRRLVGRVVNDTKNPHRAKKTVVVEVIRRFRDPFYGKYVKQKKKYHAHDEREEFRTRDLVEIQACRPKSKTKRWVATRLLERPPEV
ncbi:MAG TPA: 30S ribosomal protein S17 [Polyangiaceae bacterium LLY-WYZ-15_(1-7)]|nr:30S ribosomal protein S17 [Sandaracinus sp.]HJK94318.1 30S ribosomal protein S17 [Polyangiaceae bacterium LLY-WYZ-15_(1-7)]MBJ74679.1 30S ribosomal protein S17 [Sandaracinus sp.]HJL00130.1 30S ribosomal protein S17 [Polyangiaceae bacterium LLY-WYZ-15_(1-7)]HJL08878.1 30S ribosomal protein S17 [Polyangiaceae bacterium LLY-WYZ-15_(1-7)]|tara:strand:- start:32 stop:421 length:390 start_codon:yes stop_codon:yes gene_type:complete